MADSIHFGIRIRAEGGSQAAAELQKVGQAATGADGGLTGAGVAAKKTGSELDQAGRAAASASYSFARMGTAVAGLAAATVSVTGLTRAADAWNQLNAQLKIATGTAESGAAAYADVLRIATATGQSLEQVGTVYRRFAENAEALNLSQARVADISTTVAQAMALSGGSAESAQAALIQFGQALASGQLRGEELNSVLEQAPRLARALADGLGVGVGQLRAMAEAGELTADALVGALGRSASKVSAEFAQLPVTISRALQNVSTAWTDTVGSFEKSTGAFSAAAGAINVIADNMGGIVTAGTAAAAVIGGRYVGAVAASTAATVQDTFAKQAALRAEIAYQQAMAQTALSATARTTAIAAATAAQAKLTTATSLARGALSALGGPIGPVTTALTLGATAWAVWGNDTDKATDRAAQAAEQNLDSIIAKLTELNDRLSSASRSTYDSVVAAAERELINVQSTTRTLASQLDALGQAGVRGSPKGVEIAGQIEALISREIELQQQLAAARANTAQVGIDGLNDFAAANAVGAQKVIADQEKVLAEFAKAVERTGGVLDLGIPEHARAYDTLNTKLAELGKRTESVARLRKEQSAAAREAKAMEGAFVEGYGLSADFYTEWARLAELFAGGRFGDGAAALDALAAAQRRLLERQPAIKAAAAEQKKIDTEAETAARARAGALETLIGAEGQRVAVLEAAHGRAVEEIETLGLTEQQLARYTSAKLAAAAAADEQAAAELDAAAAMLELQGVLPEVADGYRRLAAQKRAAAQAGRVASSDEIELGSARAAETARTEWQRTADAIEDSLIDALMEGGKSGSEYIEGLFRSMVLRPVLQAVVSPVANTVTSAMGFAPPATSSSGVSMPMPSMGGLVGDGLLWAGGALGTGTALGGFATGMGTAFASGASTASTMAAGSSLMGTAGGGAAGAGMMAGAALPWIGAGLAIASMIDWGGGTPHAGAVVLSDGETATSPRSHDEVRSYYADPAAANQFIESDFTKRYQEGVAAALEPVAIGLADLYNSTLSRFGLEAGYTVGLGFSADDDDASRGRFSIIDEAGNEVDDFIRKFSSDPEAGMAGFVDASAAAVRDALVAADLPGWVDTLLTDLSEAPGIDSLNAALTEVQAFEAAAAALAGLTLPGDQLADASAALVGQFAELGHAAPRTREEFASLAGALDMTSEADQRAYVSLMRLAPAFLELEAAQQALYDQLLSDTELAARSTATVTDAFGQLGFALPASTVELRAWIDAQDASTEAGARMRAQLLGLVPAFLEVEASAQAAADAAAQMAAESMGLYQQLWQAQGDIASLRALELAALDPANWALQQQIWALDEQTAAASSAAAATGSAADSLRALGEAGALVGDYVNSLRSSGLAALSPEAQLAETRRQYRQDLALARAGDAEALQRMPQSADAYLGAAQAYYASGDLYQSIFSKTLTELENLPAVKNAEELLLEATREVAANTASSAAVVATLPSVLQASDEALNELLTASFSALDRNTDALLTRAELVSAFVDTGLASEADIDRMIAAFDANGDGMLSMLELQYARTGDLRLLAERSYAVDAAALTALADGFVTLDTTADGLLDEAELRAALVSTGLATEADIDRMVASYDANGDGLLSELELIAGKIQAQSLADAQAIAILQTGFGTLDSSVDGLLDAAELRAALVSTGLATDADIDRMIAIYDTNGDGMLSELELIAANTAVMAKRSYTEYGGGTTVAGGTQTSAGGWSYASTSSSGTVSTTTRDNAWSASAYLAANPDVGSYYAANSAQIAAAGQADSLSEYAAYHWAVYGIAENRKYARGGYASPGVALVGEQGPELVEFRDPARVFTASQTRELMAGGSDDRETRSLLRQVVSELRAVVRQSGAVGEATIGRLDLLARRIDDMGAEVRRAVAA